MEMANVDGSGACEFAESFGGGTGMYDVMRFRRFCRWTECSANGPSGVWMETARPLKHGIVDDFAVRGRFAVRAAVRCAFRKDVKMRR